jgi:hypothetical protein
MIVVRLFSDAFKQHPPLDSTEQFKMDPVGFVYRNVKDARMSIPFHGDTDLADGYGGLGYDIIDEIIILG